jgi:hypothetical protein
VVCYVSGNARGLLITLVMAMVCVMDMGFADAILDTMGMPATAPALLTSPHPPRYAQPMVSVMMDSMAPEFVIARQGGTTAAVPNSALAMVFVPDMESVMMGTSAVVFVSAYLTGGILIVLSHVKGLLAMPAMATGLVGMESLVMVHANATLL